MTSPEPFVATGELDEVVRRLLRAMLEPVAFDGATELLTQVPGSRVVARTGLDCLLSVPSGDPLSPASGERPVVVALVDASPIDRETFGEPYVGQLELHTAGGRLHALVYAGWLGPTELPDPSDLHPTTEFTGHRRLAPDHFRPGWTMPDPRG